MRRSQTEIMERASAALKAVLDLIKDNPGITIPQIAERLACSQAAVETRVRRLVVQGLVANRAALGGWGQWYAINRAPAGRSIFELVTP